MEFARSESPTANPDLLDEDLSLLQASTEDVLLDAVGLGQTMQEAFARHGDSLDSAVLWKALQHKR